jgi:Domain of unknown function (DUF4283)
MPQHNWIAQFYDDSKFLIESPDPRWLSTITTRGFLRLENNELSVSRWDPAMDEGARLQPVWIQVWGFPMKLWFFNEFVHLFELYGQVLALAPEIAEHTDFRVAWVRVGFCDTVQLSLLQWITYYDPNGFWTRYDVSMVVKMVILVLPRPLLLLQDTEAMRVGIER